MGFALSDMSVRSTAFAEGSAIPTKHTGEGEDVAPPLAWSNPPEGTRSFVVLCHDPDAPLVTGAGNYGFVHWVAYNIPASVTSLPEGGGQYTEGGNDFGDVGYGGPMPPDGHGTHRYYFWVLALDDEPNLEPGLTMWEVLAKVEPNLIGMNRLVGIYER